MWLYSCKLAGHGVTAAELCHVNVENADKQVRRKIEAQVKNDSDMELLTYMVAFACDEHAEDFLVRWGAIQEGDETTLSHEETVNFLLDHLATLNSKTRTAVILDMLSFAFQGRDLFSNLECHDVAM